MVWLIFFLPSWELLNHVLEFYFVLFIMFWSLWLAWSIFHCYNNIPETEVASSSSTLTQFEGHYSGEEQQLLWPAVLEPGKPQCPVPASAWPPGRASVLHGNMAEGITGDTATPARSLSPSTAPSANMEAPPSPPHLILITSQRPYFQMPITRIWGLSFQCANI